MSYQTECKGCSASVRASVTEIEEKLKDLSIFKGKPLVSEEEYRERISICRECSSLEYGTTCRHCGCWVQMRARLMDAYCPYPCYPKW